MKYLSIDIETTGLDVQRCDLLEFAAIIDDTEHPEVHVNNLPRYHCYNVKNTYEGEPYALSLHGEIFRRIHERTLGYVYCEDGEFGEDFNLFLEDNGYSTSKKALQCAGKNFGAFDLQFLRYTDLGDYGIDLGHRFIDPASMLMRPDDPDLPDSKECMRRCGITGQVAHTAMADALVVIKMIRFVMAERIKNV